MTRKKIMERKEYSEYLTIEDKSVLDIKKAGIESVADDEIFVLVRDTKNYWISNYGRLVNNLRGNFYKHKTGNAHYTLSAYDNNGSYYYTVDTFCDRLVAEHFLEKQKTLDRVWHIDGNFDNCHYTNLIWVNYKEYLSLERKAVSVEQLGRQQQYVPYITLKGNNAYYIWNGIYNRCYRTEETNSRECYKKATMCEQWLNDKDKFVEWYNANYYECDGESMAVDKDLLYPGNTEYAPDKCCIIPQTLNTMLSNCKKHKAPSWKKALGYPLGVRYSESMKKYCPEIKPYGHNEIVKLSYWDTPEEAFNVSAL